MKRETMLSAAVSAAVSLVGVQTATAQFAAVEWRVADGGNGHWYAVNQLGFFWHDARDFAETKGGYLATVSSDGERQVLRSLLDGLDGQLDYFLGGFRTSSSSQWQWVTGEPWSFVAWEPGAPDNGPESLHIEIIGRPFIGGNSNAGYAFLNDESFYAAGGGQRSIIERSADCDQNGLVDFGEIVRGEKADANGNNIPDCCEAALGCCPGDVDGDESVDGIDLAIILARWGTNPKDYPKADANGDGSVDGQDLSVVLNGWGGCP